MTLKEQMDLLGWKDITTNRQISNGTRIYRLPIKQYGQYIEVGSFESGYVRRMNGGYTPYQLNKRNYYDEYYKDYKIIWNKDRSDYTQKFTGKYNKMTCRGCVKIMSTRKRLQYLIDYCLKNYYIKQANMIEDGKFVPKWVYEDIKERYVKEINNVGKFLKCKDTDDMINFKYSGGQIENLENGDVFVHEQHAYWNKWKEDKPSSVDIIIDGHRYKVK
jgi:hypothetical protein